MNNDLIERLEAKIHFFDANRQPVTITAGFIRDIIKFARQQAQRIEELEQQLEQLK